MNSYRWCEQCGTKMDYQRWFRANYCGLCGTELRKEPYVWSNAGREPQEPSKIGVLPTSVARRLQAAGMIVKDHPAACSLGAIGVGVAGVVLSPLAMLAGQGIMILGGIVAGVSGYAASKGCGTEEGAKFGVGMLGIGALVYGSSYVLLGVGGLSIAAGVGGGIYSGARAIVRRSRPKRIVASEPLLLTEGGTR